MISSTPAHVSHTPLQCIPLGGASSGPVLLISLKQWFDAQNARSFLERHRRETKPPIRPPEAVTYRPEYGNAVQMETKVNIDFQLPKDQKNTDSAKPPDNASLPETDHCPFFTFLYTFIKIVLA